MADLVRAAGVDPLGAQRAGALVRLGTRAGPSARRVEETLGAGLLHRGRRDQVGAALFVHPQTVRYRMWQLRGLFPDVASPHRVLELTLAVGLQQQVGSNG
ncbi:hypothetical protein VM98_35405 [Streptomyces rubellomurinus subsp. indigoferus]|nr:hypothetical protein VM98_35405 [Streptomyces rubellomurinus subsp. indigoferus]